MCRHLTLVLLLLVALAAFASTATVTVNGKTVTVPVLEQNGKSFVDIAALMALVGGKVTINKTDTPSGGGASSGTPQLPGENGEMGQVYIMRKANPLYFRLLSADYTTRQVRIGDSTYVPNANEKLLVLHFSIQNPQKTGELLARFDTLKFTAVDAMNVNHDFCGDWGDAETHNSLGISLKPSQKIEVYTVITVPAKGVVPKLMVQSPVDNDGGVLRYDLHGKVTSLPEPIADPADASGATALTTVPGKLNEAYPYANYSVTVEKFDFTTDKIQDEDPPDGGRYLLVTLLVKNESGGDAVLRFDTFAATLTSTDNENLDFGGDLLLASAYRKLDQQVKPGAETRIRMYFKVPKDVTPKTLALKENESRTYEFAVK